MKRGSTRRRVVLFLEHGPLDATLRFAHRVYRVIRIEPTRSHGGLASIAMR